MREKSGRRAQNEPGANARFVDAETLDWLLFPRDALGAEANSCAAVEISGDSMEPLLPDGCFVLIDTSDKSPSKDAIYALRTAEGRCAVRHVEMIDERRIALIPANRAEFRAEICELAAGEKPEDRIIGRVVWRALRLKDSAGG